MFMASHYVETNEALDQPIAMINRYDATEKNANTDVPPKIFY